MRDNKKIRKGNKKRNKQLIKNNCKKRNKKLNYNQHLSTIPAQTTTTATVTLPL